jgi:hypothetical protein
MRKNRIIIKKISSNYFWIRMQVVRFWVMRVYHDRVVFFLLPTHLRFRSIWKRNYWGNSESISGPGSTLFQAANLIEHFPHFINDFKIKSIIDAPCGDFNWMKVAISGNPEVKYIGGDLVPEIIDSLKSKYATQNTEFRIFDITKDEFPKVDVWLARAIFYHFSNRDIYLALENFIKSQIPYILTTNCVTELDHKNIDIKTGAWRSLNLKLPPFNFPDSQLWEIDDSRDPHPKMKLTLWTRSQIEILLPEIKANLRI